MVSEGYSQSWLSKEILAGIAEISHIDLKVGGIEESDINLLKHQTSDTQHLTNTRLLVLLKKFNQLGTK